MVKLDISSILPLTDENTLSEYIKKAESCHKTLIEKTGVGNEYTGWLDLPKRTDEEFINKIEKTSKKLQSFSQVLIVIGIGGSYLGAKAIIEALQNPYKKEHEVIFAGNALSGKQISEIIDYIKYKDFALNVISKSGTTLETAIAFRVFKNELEFRYGKKEAMRRIVVTTDSEKGALKEMSVKEGYDTFVIPGDVGGRYSVLTPVGLIAISYAGLDIKKLMHGSRDAEEYAENTKEENAVYTYSALRNIMYEQGKNIEILVQYEPSMMYFNEWYKQLFAESEGKDGKGIFPAGAVFTTDLHSIGQYIQDGKRILFETVCDFTDDESTVKIPDDSLDLDKLNYISGKTISYVKDKALEGVIKAHVSGGVPNIFIKMPKLDEYNLGYLIYFFEISCAISGYILKINPFDQIGVEKYKKNMFTLLGKPGYTNA